MSNKDCAQVIFNNAQFYLAKWILHSSVNS